MSNEHPTLRIPLKLAILASGRSQRQVSLTAHIPEARLSDIVRRRVLPSEDERVALALALNCQAAELFPDFAEAAA